MPNRHAATSRPSTGARRCHEPGGAIRQAPPGHNVQAEVLGGSALLGDHHEMSGVMAGIQREDADSADHRVRDPGAHGQRLAATFPVFIPLAFHARRSGRSPNKPASPRIGQIVRIRKVQADRGPGAELIKPECALLGLINEKWRRSVSSIRERFEPRCSWGSERGLVTSGARPRTVRIAAVQVLGVTLVTRGRFDVFPSA